MWDASLNTRKPIPSSSMHELPQFYLHDAEARSQRSTLWERCLQVGTCSNNIDLPVAQLDSSVSWECSEDLLCSKGKLVIHASWWSLLKRSQKTMFSAYRKLELSLFGKLLCSKWANVWKIALKSYSWCSGEWSVHKKRKEASRRAADRRDVLQGCPGDSICHVLWRNDLMSFLRRT